MLILKPRFTKIRGDFQDLEAVAHTMSTAFVDSKVFSWNHLFLLKGLCKLDHSDVNSFLNCEKLFIRINYLLLRSFFTTFHWGCVHINFFGHLSANLFRFLLTLSRTALITFLVRAVVGLPLLGRSSDVRSSLSLFTAWYTMNLLMSLLISEFALPEQ